MFPNFKNKYALIMSNELKGCQEDAHRLEKILINFNFKVVKKLICFPEIEIINFLDKIDKADLIYIHYSGHGVKRGVNINNKPKILSSWLNPNKSVVCSYKIDQILSEIKCNIILTTECCHSETFGDYYNGKYPFIFIGTSKLSMISKIYSLNGDQSHGSLVYLFEYIIANNLEINLENIKSLSEEFFKNNKIESTLIIKEI
jgi:hypothetical protein